MKKLHIYYKLELEEWLGMVAGIARYLKNVPITIVVEPDSAACVMESIKSGKIEKIDIKREFNGWNVLW